MGKCPYCFKNAGIFKKVHKECELKNKNGIKHIKQKSKSFFENEVSETIDELEKVCDNSFISKTELDNILANTFAEVLDGYLDDGILSQEEENRLGEYKKHFHLTQEVLEKHDSLSRAVRASILRKLLSGEEITNKANIDGNLPFKFQKSENIIWLFNDVQLYEQRTKTTYKGGLQGISIRVTKGLYYRTSSFKGQPVKSTNIVPIAKGIMVLTNKHIYFSSSLKNFRINYDKIITVDPYSDGVGIQKDGVSAKPQIFSNIDGWFCYNFIKNISE
tara:strand:- start:1400 stop:2224 length:825 start_codon:yes stop_codon:yes gene_type:complete